MAEDIDFDTYEATCKWRYEEEGKQHVICFTLDKPISFQPGQYMTVMFPGMKPAPFSIASSVASKKLELAVEVIGPVTGKLGEMKPNDTVPMKGPFGRFVMQQEQKVCFIAGGIGIAPFMSMLRSIKDLELDKDAVLLYSCKSPGRFLWTEELDKLGEKGNIKIVRTVTQDTEGWTGKSGRITAQMIRGAIPNYEKYTYFVCGPLDMITDMFEMLQNELNIPFKNLRREVWN